MTLKELRDALRAYPGDHSCPEIEGYDCDDYDPSMLAFISDESETGTVGEWLARVEEVFGSDVGWTKGGTFHMNGDTEVTYTLNRHEMGDPLGPTFLRVLLGPVPVVLPDGCGVNVSTGAREYLEDHLLLTDMGEDGLMIEKGCIRHFIAPATLQWLRTGEVMP